MASSKLASMTHGKVFYYDPATDSLDQLVKETLKNYPSESVVCFRSSSPLAKVHNSALFGELERYHFQVEKVEKTLRGKEKYTVPKLVRLYATKKSKIDATKLKADLTYIKDWQKYVDALASGAVEKFDCCINSSTDDYVEGLRFERMFDIRSYHGNLLDYYNIEEVKANPKAFKGTLYSTLYVGQPGDAFPWHVEDGFWSSLNTCINGDTVWIFPASRSDVKRLFQELNKWAGDSCPNPHNRKVYFCSPEKLLNAGINLKYLIQTTNDIIFTLPLGAHMGMSLSPTIGIAKNCFDDEDWVSVALYMKEWSKCRKGCWKENPGHLSDDMDVEEILKKLVSSAKLEKEELGESPYPLRWSLRSKWTDRERMVCADCGKQVAVLFNLERHNKTNCKPIPKNLQLKAIPDYAMIQ